jgi:hypothetical protein
VNHLVHNERLRLLGNSLNNVGLAFVIGGFVAPTLTGQVFGWRALLAIVWIGLGAALHACAQLVIGRLKP